MSKQMAPDRATQLLVSSQLSSSYCLSLGIGGPHLRHDSAHYCAGSPVALRRWRPAQPSLAAMAVAAQLWEAKACSWAGRLQPSLAHRHHRPWFWTRCRRRRHSSSSSTRRSISHPAFEEVSTSL